MYRRVRAVLIRAAFLAILHPAFATAQTTIAPVTRGPGDAPADFGAPAASLQSLASSTVPVASVASVASVPSAALTDVRADREIALGETKTGTLTIEDPQLDDGEYYHSYFFEGRANDRVIVSLRSASFDSYLAILLPDTKWTEQDDDGGGSSDAELDVTLPGTGRYVIVVTSYGGEETGAYTLSVTASDGAARPDDDWTLYGRTGQEAELYFRSASIRRYAEGVFEVWTRWAYSGMQPASPGGDPYDSEKRLMRVSCESERLGMVSFVEYSGEAVVNTLTIKDVEMQPAVPGSVGESLLRRVCSR